MCSLLKMADEGGEETVKQGLLKKMHYFEGAGELIVNKGMRKRRRLGEEQLWLLLSQLCTHSCNSNSGK
jgi:hypothetical protein